MTEAPLQGARGLLAVEIEQQVRGGDEARMLHEAFGSRLSPAPAIASLIEDGRLGHKSSRGFYRYRNGKRGGVDSSIYDLIGVRPTHRPAPEDVEQRLVLAMLNEAARALSAGVVRQPRDGDIGAIFGFGFPAFRGGPLRYIDDRGAASIVTDLERYASRLGDRFAPARPLRAPLRF